MSEWVRVEKQYYSWIQVGDIEVFVGDIQEDDDEKAILQQIDAIYCGWA